MGVKFEFHYWMKKYEKDYPKDTGGKYPIFVDERGVEHEETSPYFETMSTVLQKRGYLLKKEFVSIGEWKTERQRKRYESNTDQKIERVTRKVFRAPYKDKIKILVRTRDKLHGVGIPVASAILTVAYPKEFCIIDYRTWRAILWLRTLETKRSCTFASYREYSGLLDSYDRYGTIGVYLKFLGTLKDIGEKVKMTPRQVEMALWKFDQMKGAKRKNDKLAFAFTTF